ncbi:MAG: hypothetical protein ABGY95_10190 [Rubritalea sp.]|uniref:hypothetical protein n=1 Tax=Rubritalea sp. TaxID=2109375 RepID=UPI00324230DF
MSEETMQSLGATLNSYACEKETSHSANKHQALVLTPLIRLKKAATGLSIPYKIITDYIVSKHTPFMSETANTELAIAIVTDSFKLPESHMRSVYRDSA